MTSPTQNPSLEDVLGAFSMETNPGRETLEIYLRRYPAFAEALIDLSRELCRALPTTVEPLTAEDEARVDAAWRRHVEALSPQAHERFSPTQCWVSKPAEGTTRGHCRSGAANLRRRRGDRG